MALSKKHFEAVARIINDRTQKAVAVDYVRDWEHGQLYALEQIAQDLSHYFASENPNFDRERFLAACNPAS